MWKFANVEKDWGEIYNMMQATRNYLIWTRLITLENLNWLFHLLLLKMFQITSFFINNRLQYNFLYTWNFISYQKLLKILLTWLVKYHFFYTDPVTLAFLENFVYKTTVYRK